MVNCYNREVYFDLPLLAQAFLGCSQVIDLELNCLELNHSNYKLFSAKPIKIHHVDDKLLIKMNNPLIESTQCLEAVIGIWAI